MIHVHVYERWWIILTIIMLVAFTLALALSAFAGGIQVPSPEARVDPQTIAKTAPFDNPGLRELAPGKYEAYVLAQASPWKFYPSEIQVPVGATVTFYVTSVDVQHGFKVEGTNINMMILPGQVSKLTTTFNQAGEFPYVCTEYCGVGHQNMFGKIIVGP
jgi:cytochrome c oxidase subunit 2